MYDMADGVQSRLADAAVAEYFEAIERGAPPDLEEFLARHADAGDALREFLADYQAIEHLSPRLAPATASSAHTTGRMPAGKYPRLELPRVFGNFELLELRRMRDDSSALAASTTTRARACTSSPVSRLTYETPVAFPSGPRTTSRTIAFVSSVSFPVACAGAIRTSGLEKFDRVAHPRPHWPQ